MQTKPSFKYYGKITNEYWLKISHIRQGRQLGKHFSDPKKVFALDLRV